MKKYIRFLNKLDRFRPAGLMWSHTGTDGQGLWISTVGYCHSYQDRIESKLLKFGLRHDFDRPLQEFDRISGRTITYFKTMKGK
jgi:hypothetical protein